MAEHVLTAGGEIFEMRVALRAVGFPPGPLTDAQVRLIYNLTFAGEAHKAERRPRNAEAAGSIPAIGLCTQR